MHKKTRKIFSQLMVLLLCAILVGNSGIALAATDVSSTHWANAQIQTMVSQNIQPLYADGSFKPESVVTNLETVVSVYRAVKGAGLLDNAKITTLSTKYDASLAALGLPRMLAPYGSDVYPALSYAIEYGILTLDEIKVFISGTTLTNVKKINAAVIVAKALNVYKQENLNKIILLSYKDAAEISLSAIKYVNLLIEHGIVSSKGDALGKFNPNATINRATLAIFINGLYKALTTGDNQTPSTGTEGTSMTPTPTNPTTPTDNTSTDPGSIATSKIFSGLVKAVDDSTLSVTVQNTSGTQKTFVLDQAVITAAGNPASFNQITLDAQIELTLNGDIVTGAALERTFDRLEGTLALVSDYIGLEKNRRTIKTTLANKTVDFKNIYDGQFIVTINGLKADVKDLKIGYKIEVYYDGFNVKRINAYAELYEFIGILETPVDVKAPGNIAIKLENNNIYSSKLGAAVSYVNAANGFKRGDIVKATLKFGEVTKLEYIGQAKTVVGRITGIHIKKAPEMTVTLSTGAVETYPLSSKVKLLTEGGENTLSIYDFRLEQDVTVDVGIGGIIKVQLGRKIVAEPTGIKATVSQVVDSSNILLVVDESNRIRTVTFPSNSAYKASTYKAGQVLFIEGKAIADTIFEVIKITVQTP